MKRIVSLALLLVFALTSIPCFASGQFTYEYKETAFRDHLTTITTESNITDAIRMAADELNIAGYLIGGLALAPIKKAIADNVSKAVLKKTISSSMAKAGGVGVSERFASAVLNHLNLKATKIVSRVKDCYKYQVNMSTGKKTIASHWQIFERKIYKRNSESSSWYFVKTEQIKVVIQ